MLITLKYFLKTVFFQYKKSKYMICNHIYEIQISMFIDIYRNKKYIHVRYITQILFKRPSETEKIPININSSKETCITGNCGITYM